MINTLLISFFLSSILVISCNPADKTKTETTAKPNIIIIYADDLGYGDVSAYNTNSKINTPNIDLLAEEGVLFTDAHSPAGICAPSRYSLLTGRYAWREPNGTILGHPYSECKIPRGYPTIASLLNDNGYNTAQIGKWGVRSDIKAALKDSTIPMDEITPQSFDFSKALHTGIPRGFDYTFSMVILAGYDGEKYLKNDKWFFENGFPHGGTTPDPANFDWYACLPTLTNKVVNYIATYAGERNDTIFRINKDEPFFIYYDPHVPHLPIVPNEEFVGTSGASEYGDFVSEFDYSVGQIMKELDKHGLTENTLIIVSSDNGPENVVFQLAQDFGHYSMGEYRGIKRDIWEGGHRVPFIARWPKYIPATSKCNEPIGLIDMLATISAITGFPVPEGFAEDSYNVLPALLGKAFETPLREPLIYHTYDKRFAVRQGDWVFINASSGRQNREPQWFIDERGAVPHNLEVELFNLLEDKQQLHNVADKYPEKVKEMKTLLMSIMEDK